MGTPPDQTRTDQHRHQGLRNEAGTPSFSTRWFPPLLIRVGTRCTASSTRNRLSAPGSPSPRGAHSHPPSSHGCRPLRMQELLRNATTPFLPPPHIRPRGPATAPGGVMLHHGPLPMDGPWDVLHQVRRPYQSTTQPSLPSFQVRSNLVIPFPPVLPPASFILAGPWVLRNTMVRPPPDDNIVEWEPFSFPTASWAMLSVA